MSAFSECFSRMNIANGKIHEDKVEAQFKESMIKKGYMSMAKHEPSLFQYIMRDSPSRKVKASPSKDRKFRLKETNKKPKFMRPDSKVVEFIPDPSK